MEVAGAFRYNSRPLTPGNIMTTLTDKDIDKIASLAKLSIPATQHTDLLAELNKILRLVDKMAQVNTDDITPLAHPYDEIQPLRQDAVTETDQRSAFQQIAPQVEAGLYIVPTVIDSE